MGYVRGARNRESPCCSMEASKHTPNGAKETPGGTTKTPGLPWRIAIMFDTSCSNPSQAEGN